MTHHFECMRERNGVAVWRMKPTRQYLLSDADLQFYRSRTGVLPYEAEHFVKGGVALHNRQSGGFEISSLDSTGKREVMHFSPPIEEEAAHAIPETWDWLDGWVEVQPQALKRLVGVQSAKPAAVCLLFPTHIPLQLPNHRGDAVPCSEIAMAFAMCCVAASGFMWNARASSVVKQAASQRFELLKAIAYEEGGLFEGSEAVSLYRVLD